MKFRRCSWPTNELKHATCARCITTKRTTDADAHWNAALCRYGIEYVKDPESGKRIPTCHRANWDSILSDVDYLAAIHFADPMARKVYETDGKYIDEVQKNILAISRT